MYSNQAASSSSVNSRFRDLLELSMKEKIIQLCATAYAQVYLCLISFLFREKTFSLVKAFAVKRRLDFKFSLHDWFLLAIHENVSLLITQSTRVFEGDDSLARNIFRSINNPTHLTVVMRFHGEPNCATESSKSLPTQTIVLNHLVKWKRKCCKTWMKWIRDRRTRSPRLHVRSKTRLNIITKWVSEWSNDLRWSGWFFLNIMQLTNY